MSLCHGKVFVYSSHWCSKEVINSSKFPLNWFILTFTKLKLCACWSRSTFTNRVFAKQQQYKNFTSRTPTRFYFHPHIIILVRYVFSTKDPFLCQPTYNTYRPKISLRSLATRATRSCAPFGRGHRLRSVTLYWMTAMFKCLQDTSNTEKPSVNS